jgi:hypothetical protein
MKATPLDIKGIDNVYQGVFVNGPQLDMAYATSVSIKDLNEIFQTPMIASVYIRIGGDDGKWFKALYRSSVPSCMAPILYGEGGDDDVKAFGPVLILGYEPENPAYPRDLTEEECDFVKEHIRIVLLTPEGEEKFEPYLVYAFYDCRVCVNPPGKRS